MSSLVQLLSLHLPPIKVKGQQLVKGILSPQVHSFRQLPPSRSALYYHMY